MRRCPGGVRGQPLTYCRYVLDNLKFAYPVFITTFHMAFAALGTRILARYTNLLDGLSMV